MSREESIDTFNGYYGIIVEYEIGSVIRESLGSYSLKFYKEKIIEIFDGLKFIFENSNLFGNDFFSKAASFVQNVHETFQSIRALNDTSYTGSFNQNKKKLENLYEEFLDLRHIIFSNKSEKSSDIQKIRKEFDIIKEQVDETKKLKENLDNLDSRYSDMIPKLELFKQREIFKHEARKNNKESNYWLVGICISFISLLLLIWLLFKNFCFEASCFNLIELKNYNAICNDCGEQVLWLEIFKSLLFRILIISIALYLLSFTVKNYNNSKHNLTINRHKQNSFEAALVLIHHTDSGKDEIISKAAQAIFVQQKTGYIAKENDNNNAGLIEQIINLKKDI